MEEMAHSKGDPYISVAEKRWSTDQGHDGEEAQGMMRIKVSRRDETTSWARGGVSKSVLRSNYGGG